MNSRFSKIYTCFPGGKHKVLTMSYDGGREDDRKLIDIFNTYEIKGTFHLCGGIDWDERRIPLGDYNKVYQGHEIASHTYTRPNLTRIPIEQVILQVLDNRKVLEAIVKYPVQGFSYPYGAYNKAVKETLKTLGVRYSRITGNSESFELPNDFYEWKPTCHQEHNLLELGRQFTELHNHQYLSLFYIWGRSYELTNEHKWEQIEKFCELVGNKSDTWYATSIQIVMYIEAANQLQYGADLGFVYNPSAISVWVSIDRDIIEIPGGKQVNLS
ncbi:MAG: polysaccharide deacetylase [Anaerocolumna sp.]|jgi:hypothetical protein|nr:polysaccharide deacetylase [Anaerocolumna sp.]